MDKRRRRAKIAVLCLLCVAGVVALLLSPLFRIKRITVNPLSAYEEEQISAHLEDLIGANGFQTVFRYTSFSQFKSLLAGRLPAKEEELIFQLPYLKDVKIRYSFPNKLEVEAQERIPIFLSKQKGIYLYVDSEGYLLETYTEEDKPGLPVVLGLEFQDYKIGCPLTNGEDARADAAIRLCNMMRQLSILDSDIALIDLTDLDDVWMYCKQGISIRFGPCEDYGMKLSKLKAIQDISYGGKTNGVLDFTSGGNPVFRENQEGEGVPGGNPDDEAGDDTGDGQMSEPGDTSHDEEEAPET